MAHLTSSLPAAVEIGAVRTVEYMTEVVRQVGGGEVRNALWAEPLTSFECAMPTARLDDANYLAVIALYREALGQLHSFDFTYRTEGGDTVFAVRFATQLSITAPTGELDHIDSFTLVEVRG